VKTLIKNKDKYSDVLKALSVREIMHQTALGLDYLHGLAGNFIHRNIHARNVLVAEIGSRKRYVVKLSDFRFGKSIMKKEDKEQSNRPIRGWPAPEMLSPSEKDKLGPWTDVFILGCFFYYVLSGVHPFGKKGSGNTAVRSTNIKNGTYSSDCWTRNLVTDKFTILIKNMTKRATEDRTSLSQVLQHFQRDAGDFPLYKALDKVRPGLCVIINQKEFPAISKVY
jgi:serine/threonine protein kinase